jgi:ABC-type transport system substrate-binding protein
VARIARWTRFALAAATVLAGGCRAPERGGAETDVPTLYLNTSRIRGFDPAKVNDLDSGRCIMRVYEGLLQHSYLERPFKLEPLLCTAMPDVSPDGLVYSFRLRPGIRFSDDPCFTNRAGRGRELVAEDFVYSLKRLADLKNASVAWWILDGKIKGLDAFREASGGDAPTDYAAPVEGLRALDAHSLRIELTQPYAQLLWVLAMHHCVAVPREAVEFYGDQLTVHPVGTGPFVLNDWVRNYRLEFVRNPAWAASGRVDRYPDKGAPGDAEAGLLADAGRPLPLCDRVVEYVISDPATEWLMFLNGQLDQIRAIARDNWDLVVDEHRRLRPGLAERGIQLFSGPQMSIGYFGYNMDDPLFATNARLRQAMSCAFNHEEWIRLNNYRVMEPTGPIPRGVDGYPEEPLPFRLDLERAAGLLAEAGYPKGIDPATGRRLEIVLDVGRADSVETRQGVELFVSMMDKIGIVIRPSYNNWPTFLQKLEHRQVQMYYLAWTADYPDAQNFLLLFYSKSASPGPNHSNYRNPRFDELFEASMKLSAGPERTALYRRMADIARQDCPWIFRSDNLDFVLWQKWARNYKFHPLAMGLEKYQRVEEAVLRDARFGAGAAR